jgi:AsmA protein
VAVAVMPLLSQQVRVQRIEVDGLKTTLIKRKDGSLSIDDLAGGPADKAVKTTGSEAESKTETSPVQIDIAGIKIANASLTWRDEMSGTTTSLSNLDLASPAESRDYCGSPVRERQGLSLRLVIDTDETMAPRQGGLRLTCMSRNFP